LRQGTEREFETRKRRGAGHCRDLPSRTCTADAHGGCARWRDLDGKSRSRTFDRKIDAERFLERVGADLQPGEYTDPALRRVHFNDWADQFWATATHVKPSTRRGYRQALENHLRRAFGARSIGSIDRAEIKRWATAQLERGTSPKSVRNWLSVLILAFEEAIDAKAIRENPARRVKLHHAPRTQTTFFTAEQIERVAEAIEPPQYAAPNRPAQWGRLPEVLILINVSEHPPSVHPSVTELSLEQVSSGRQRHGVNVGRIRTSDTVTPDRAGCSPRSALRRRRT
jgi:hypothetical protein